MFTREELRDIVLSILKTEVVQQALKRLAISNGFKAFIITYVVGEFFDDIVAPVLLLAERKVQRVYDKKKGEFLYVEFKRAVEKKNWDDIKSASDAMRS